MTSEGTPAAAADERGGRAGANRSTTLRPSAPARRVSRREQVHEPGDDAGPAGLVAGAEAGAVVAVEVLVEQQAVAPVRIVLELLASPP